MPKIIFVDDEEDLEHLIVQRFAKKTATMGYELMFALDGQAALQKIEDHPDIDIALIDINMPKMNGIEFLRALRSDPELSSLSVFIMTTSNDEQDKFEAYKLNVAGYVLKPLSFEKFVSAVSILSSYWKLCEHPELSNA